MKVRKALITEIITALFILLFVYTATTKLINRESFLLVLSQSPLIGNASGILSWFIPMSELITVGLLFIPAIRLWGFICSLSIMVIFTIYITYMIFFAQNLPCSCGGVISRMTWNQHLIFNILLTALAIVGLQITLRNKLFIAINRHSRTPV